LRCEGALPKRWLISFILVSKLMIYGKSALSRSFVTSLSQSGRYGPPVRYCLLFPLLRDVKIPEKIERVPSPYMVVAQVLPSSGHATRTQGLTKDFFSSLPLTILSCWTERYEMLRAASSALGFPSTFWLKVGGQLASLFFSNFLSSSFPQVRPNSGLLVPFFPPAQQMATAS